MLRKTTLSLLILSVIALSTVLGPGDLDPTFDTDGKVRTDFPVTASMGGAALQADGKIVIAGVAGSTDPYIVVRYLSDGSPDPTFGAAYGKQVAPFTVFARAVAVQA